MNICNRGGVSGTESNKQPSRVDHRRYYLGGGRSGEWA